MRQFTRSLMVAACLAVSHAAAHAASSSPQSAPAPLHQASGTVLKIEPSRITLDHGPVPSLNWPSMRMPFGLARPELAQGLKPGDGVRFRFSAERGRYTITEIERSQ